MFSRFRKINPSKSYITIVSGLPRSGTSMMIKMLAAGGIEPLTDNLRTADEENPNGYYEFERVKALKDGDTTWVESALGKSVKVISALLQNLPASYDYRVIFMQRNMPEILASQQKMLVSRGQAPSSVSDEQIAELYRKHLRNIGAWIEEQPYMKVIYVHYNNLLKDPDPDLERVNQFLDSRLDLDAMVAVIDTNLYRQRQA